MSSKSESVDYVIVGGGAAGCTLAARLSEDPSVSVCVIEAGSSDRNPYLHLPAGFFKVVRPPFIWDYTTLSNGRPVPYPQGRVLGGGSSVNAMVFTRGCPEDYDAWAEGFGCDGWGYESVRPYFQRSEGNDVFAGPHHGTDGPLTVSSPAPQKMTRVFVQAAQEAGLPYRADFNAGEQAGAGFYQSFTRDGRRSSAARVYLRPALKRPNLTLRTDAQVLRVVIENGRAIGVELAGTDGPTVLNASREVIVTAGAIGSPKLLMLSGVGPAAELEPLGIEMRRDLPGVGANLHDHMDVDLLAQLNGPHGIDRYKRPHWQAWAGLQYALFRSGPAASNIVEAGAFWWGDRAEKTPDLQLHFLPGAGLEGGIGGVPGGQGCTINTYFLRPRSRGRVRLSSADPLAMPEIELNAFDDPVDLERTVDGLELCREILMQPAFAPYLAAEHLPGPACRSRAEMAAFAREHARSAYHPVGTCRMGGDEASVVDPQLRVRGVAGLRVCDSSVMPRIVSSNTNAATIMIAERAADLIRGRGAA
jgi:choline dehydrogenase-like flavoprotein